MTIHFDFETRSTVDLKTCGMHRYAESIETEILCLGYSIDDSPVELWTPDQPFPSDLLQAAKNNALFYAHNVAFDFLIWNHVLCAKHPEIPKLQPDQLRDVAAMAVAYGLPRSLNGASKALGLTTLKDDSGTRLINQLSKPDKHGNFNNDPVKLQKLYAYCEQDVRTVRALADKLPELTEHEQAIWVNTQRMNQRGLPVAGNEIQQLQALVETEFATCNTECQKLTGYNLTQKAKIKQWLLTQGCVLPNMQAATVEAALPKHQGDVHRVLELLTIASGSATKKLSKMLQVASSDGTLKGQILYHGASTGRFSSAGINIQNLARPPLNNITVEDVLAGKHDGNQKLKAIASCIRSVIKAPKNQTFIDADFTSIENRIAYWVVDDKNQLGLFIRGEDEYKKFASIMYRKPANDISANERQVAKSAVLGCMYGAGDKAYKEYAQGYGITIHDAEAKRIVDTYRATHPYIVGGWKNCEEAALLAVYHSKLTQYGKLQFDGRTDGILKIKLPSGRDMIFQKP